MAEKLGLTAEQKTKLKTLASEARRKQDDLNATNKGQPVDASKRQAYKQKLDQITAERKKQSFAVLTDDQQAKFKALQGEKFDTSTIQPNRKSFSSHGRIGGPAQVPRPNESTSN